jgi:hypothetical protein
MRSYPGATADGDHIPGFSKLAVAQRGRRSVFLKYMSPWQTRSVSVVLRSFIIRQPEKEFAAIRLPSPEPRR